MINSAVILRSCSTSYPTILEHKNHCSRTSCSCSFSSRFASPVFRCCSSSSKCNAYIPKLEPFNRTKFERVVKDPPLIEKSEHELADYCSTLEGDDSYSCWRAYFELKNLEKDTPKEDVENLILQAGGVKTLIGCLQGIAALQKTRHEKSKLAKASITKDKPERQCPIPDGIPKSLEELEEEESARMPDSPFTRLLRTKGSFPAWYSPAPDHETD